VAFSRRRFIVQTIYYIACAALGFFSRDIISDVSGDRRFVLYNIMKELRKGMSRSEVEAIGNRHYAPFVERHESNDILTFSVWLSALRALYLKITFAEQALARAEFVGIDSPSDIPRDSPSPIL
jgi:hypothetical protein